MNFTGKQEFQSRPLPARRSPAIQAVAHQTPAPKPPAAQAVAQAVPGPRNAFAAEVDIHPQKNIITNDNYLR